MDILIICKNAITRTGFVLILNEYLPGFQIRHVDDLNSVTSDNDFADPEMVIICLEQSSDKIKRHTLSEVKRKHSSSQIIVYEDFIDYNGILNYFKWGAKGFLSGRSDACHLIECIQNVSEGRLYCDTKMFFDLILQNTKPTMESAITGHVRFTNREKQIAECLANGMRTTSIAKKLGRKCSTISTIKSNIFRKLNVDNIISFKEVMRSS